MIEIVRKTYRIMERIRAFFIFFGGVIVKENVFQAKLIKAIREAISDAIVLKNDCGYLQGFPDLTVLLPNGRWAVLECKISADAAHQPNQDYYISRISGNTCGYATFVYPENLSMVLTKLNRMAYNGECVHGF